MDMKNNIQSLTIEDFYPYIDKERFLLYSSMFKDQIHETLLVVDEMDNYSTNIQESFNYFNKNNPSFLLSILSLQDKDIIEQIMLMELEFLEIFGFICHNL